MQIHNAATPSCSPPSTASHIKNRASCSQFALCIGGRETGGGGGGGGGGVELEAEQSKMRGYLKDDDLPRRIQGMLT